jgi:hypothetical protein
LALAEMQQQRKHAHLLAAVPYLALLRLRAAVVVGLIILHHQVLSLTVVLAALVEAVAQAHLQMLMELLALEILQAQAHHREIMAALVS